MPVQMTRRHFIGNGLALGAGLGLSRLALAQTGDASMSLELSGAITQIHDPVIIKADDAYYLFCTGNGISVRRSADLLNWERPFPAAVFGRAPGWAVEMIPGAGSVWAPDISFYNGKYHLYYSVSTFGSNRSVIGLATNTTLNSQDDGYGWEDQRLVIESSEANNYNCIDPNLVMDADGQPWLAFGSHWSGIKMVRLDAETGKPSEDDTTLYDLASRRVHPRAVEAPFIIRKDDFYYLFVSFDQCCQSTSSTYRVMVGRSENVTGPYVDRDGEDMMEDGGTQVTFPTERWRGPGHNAVLQEDGVDYIVYHAYDAENLGAPTLRIDPLVWDDEGWPSIPGQG